jgi:hypothetical protein
MSIKTKTILVISIFIIFAYSLSTPAYAQKTRKFDVTSNEVVGDVEIILPNTFKWIPAPAEVGSVFTDGVQIRTGPFASISRVLAYSNIACPDSFAFMIIDKFLKSGNVVSTMLDLIVSSIVNASNEGALCKNDYKVAMPFFMTSLINSEIKGIVVGDVARGTAEEKSVSSSAIVKFSIG